MLRAGEEVKKRYKAVCKKRSKSAKKKKKNRWLLEGRKSPIEEKGKQAKIRGELRTGGAQSKVDEKLRNEDLKGRDNCGVR